MTPESQPNIARLSSHPRPVSDAVADGRRARSLHHLSRLHDEAFETAQLANLLGRAPFVAWLMVAGMAVVSLTSAGSLSLTPLLLWCLFSSAAVVAVLYLYQRAIVAPFELMPLRAFSADLRAALFFAGVAWGAGAFLALPTGSHPLALVIFSAGTAAGVSAILRNPSSLYFLVPAVILTEMAALTRSFAQGGWAALSVLVAGLAIAGAVWLSGRWRARRLGIAPLSLVTFS